MVDARHLLRDTAVALRRGEREPDFFQFVRALEESFPDQPRIGAAVTASAEPLRFGQEPYLKFPETSLAMVTPAGPAGRPLILVYFFGLYGVCGPMPLELTDLVFQRSRNYLDPTLQRFSDIIHHRMISLFYRAWATNEESAQFDRPSSDLVGRAILSLAGMPGDEPELGLPAFSARSYANFLSRQPRTAGGLAKILTLFTKSRVAVRDLVEGEFDIPDRYRCRLGRRGVAVLGESAQVGARYVSRTRRFVVELGPVRFSSASSFFPEGEGFSQIVALVRMYLDKPREFTIRLVVSFEGKASPALGKGASLSRNVWLGGARRGTSALDFPVINFGALGARPGTIGQGITK